MSNLQFALRRPITYRCMVCRWLFTVPGNISPTCTNCGCTSQFHELSSVDFLDEDRYKEFGPAHARNPGVQPPLKLWVPGNFKNLNGR